MKSFYYEAVKRLDLIDKKYEEEKKSRDEEKENHSCEIARLKEENQSLQSAVKEKDDLLESKDRDLVVRKTFYLRSILSKTITKNYQFIF